MRPYCLLSLSSLFYRLISHSSLIFSTHYHHPPWAVHRPSIFPLKDRRASVFSINRSSSARIMWIKPAGDLFTASARGCSLLALARLHCQIVEKIVYGHATSFLNRFSPFSKECNLLTTTFAIQSFNKGLKRPFPFNVFIHWHMLAMRFQSPSISHSYPSLLQHLLLTLVLSTCLLLRAIPWCFCFVSYW